MWPTGPLELPTGVGLRCGWVPHAKLHPKEKVHPPAIRQQTGLLDASLLSTGHPAPRSRLTCCTPSILASQFPARNIGSRESLAFKSDCHFENTHIFIFSIHWKKNVHVQNAYGCALRTTSPYMAPFCISIVIIKSHNFQTPFYQISDDFLISARFTPSRALACLLNHVRIWLEPRQPSLHPR